MSDVEFKPGTPFGLSIACSFCPATGFEVFHVHSVPWPPEGLGEKMRTTFRALGWLVVVKDGLPAVSACPKCVAKLWAAHPERMAMTMAAGEHP